MTKHAYHHGDLKKALIKAGVEVLAEEGVFSLSLRKVAQRAGVSHAAPYAHFADKQALVAAISTQGLERVAERLDVIRERFAGDPLRELVQTAWAYLRFAIEDPAHFKITFSGAVEKEQNYPALVAMTRKNFDALRQMTEHCQAAGILQAGPADVIAVGVWSQVHGLAALILENQLSHSLLEEQPPKTLLLAGLQQLVQVPIDPKLLDEVYEPIPDFPTADR